MLEYIGLFFPQFIFGLTRHHLRIKSSESSSLVWSNINEGNGRVFIGALVTKVFPGREMEILFFLVSLLCFILVVFCDNSGLQESFSSPSTTPGICWGNYATSVSQCPRIGFVDTLNKNLKFQRIVSISTSFLLGGIVLISEKLSVLKPRHGTLYQYMQPFAHVVVVIFRTKFTTSRNLKPVFLAVIAMWLFELCCAMKRNYMLRNQSPVRQFTNHPNMPIKLVLGHACVTGILFAFTGNKGFSFLNHWLGWNEDVGYYWFAQGIYVFFGMVLSYLISSWNVLETYGEETVIFVAQLSYLLRIILYFFSHKHEWLPYIGIFAGVPMTAFQFSIISLIHKHSWNNPQLLIHGQITGLYYGFATGFGSWIVSVLVKRFQHKYVYGGAFIAMVVWMLVSWRVGVALRQVPPNPPPSDPPAVSSSSRVGGIGGIIFTLNDLDPPEKLVVDDDETLSLERLTVDENCPYRYWSRLRKWFHACFTGFVRFLPIESWERCLWCASW